MQDPQQIWREFCQRLERAGETVFGSDLADREREQAEAIRYLTRLVRIGLEMHLEHADAAHPQFYQASHDTAKIGADNPDNFYQNATISGKHGYRLTGQRGSVPILSFATKANRYASGGGMASTGELDIREVELDHDGNFEIILSKKKSSGNWLPMADDTSMLLVRQTFFDRDKEKPARVQIEKLGEASEAIPLDLDKMASALTTVSNFVAGTSTLFEGWAQRFRDENFNQLNTIDQTAFIAAGGDPMIHYLHGWWELEDDEMLCIHSPISQCEGWNFQLNNIWMESLDYRFHQIHTNNGLAVPNADGSVTLTVANRPQSGNWIDTAGHRKGSMLWRWTGASEHPVPSVERKKLTKLESEEGTK